MLKGRKRVRIAKINKTNKNNKKDEVLAMLIKMRLIEEERKAMSKKIMREKKSEKEIKDRFRRNFQIFLNLCYLLKFSRYKSIFQVQKYSPNTENFFI